MTEELKKEEKLQAEEAQETAEEMAQENLEPEIEEEDELITTKKTLDEMNDRYLRVQAEYAH